MTTLLIGLEEIKQYKSISSNIDVSKNLEPYINDAQEIDLRLFLGEQFYIDLMEDFEGSPSLSKYSDLFNGSTFTFQSFKYKHPGLKAVLAYFAYERYILNANVQSTRFGVVTKKNPDSEPASEATIRRLAASARSQAVFFQGQVKRYLDMNANDFEFWFCGHKRRKGSMRISAAGGSYTQRGRDLNRNKTRCRCGENPCICYRY